MRRRTLLIIAIIAALGLLMLLPSITTASGPTLWSTWGVRYCQKLYDAPSYAAAGSYVLPIHTVEVKELGPDGWVRVRIYRWSWEATATGWVPESAFGTSLYPLTVRFA